MRLPGGRVLLLLCLVFPASLVMAAMPPGTSEQKKEGTPIVIRSQSLEIDDTKKVVTFRGEVNAVDKEFVLDCRTMRIFYEANPEGNPATRGRETRNRIDRIEASGDVVITRKAGGKAFAQEAIYYQKEEKLVLTGNPEVRQGEDLVKGDRITIFLKENRSVVESLSQGKVKAVIYPKGREGRP